MYSPPTDNFQRGRFQTNSQRWGSAIKDRMNQIKTNSKEQSGEPIREEEENQTNSLLIRSKDWTAGPRRKVLHSPSRASPGARVNPPEKSAKSPKNTNSLQQQRQGTHASNSSLQGTRMSQDQMVVKSPTSHHHHHVKKRTRDHKNVVGSGDVFDGESQKPRRHKQRDDQEHVESGVTPENESGPKLTEFRRVTSMERCDDIVRRHRRAEARTKNQDPGKRGNANKGDNIKSRHPKYQQSHHRSQKSSEQFYKSADHKYVKASSGANKAENQKLYGSQPIGFSTTQAKANIPQHKDKHNMFACFAWVDNYVQGRLGKQKHQQDENLTEKSRFPGPPKPPRRHGNFAKDQLKRSSSEGEFDTFPFTTFSSAADPTDPRNDPFSKENFGGSLSAENRPYPTDMGYHWRADAPTTGLDGQYVNLTDNKEHGTIGGSEDSPSQAPGSPLASFISRVRKTFMGQSDGHQSMESPFWPKKIDSKDAYNADKMILQDPGLADYHPIKYLSEIAKEEAQGGQERNEIMTKASDNSPRPEMASFRFSLTYLTNIKASHRSDAQAPHQASKSPITSPTHSGVGSTSATTEEKDTPHSGYERSSNDESISDRSSLDLSEPEINFESHPRLSSSDMIDRELLKIYQKYKTPGYEYPLYRSPALSQSPNIVVPQQIKQTVKGGNSWLDAHTDYKVEDPRKQKGDQQKNTNSNIDKSQNDQNLPTSDFQTVNQASAKVNSTSASLMNRFGFYSDSSPAFSKSADSGVSPSIKQTAIANLNIEPGAKSSDKLDDSGTQTNQQENTNLSLEKPQNENNFPSEEFQAMRQASIEVDTTSASPANRFGYHSDRSPTDIFTMADKPEIIKKAHTEFHDTTDTQSSHRPEGHQHLTDQPEINNIVLEKGQNESIFADIEEPQVINSQVTTGIKSTGQTPENYYQTQGTSKTTEVLQPRTTYKAHKYSIGRKQSDIDSEGPRAPPPTPLDSQLWSKMQNVTHKPLQTNPRSELSLDRIEDDILDRENNNDSVTEVMREAENVNPESMSDVTSCQPDQPVIIQRCEWTDIATYSETVVINTANQKDDNKAYERYLTELETTVNARLSTDS